MLKELITLLQSHQSGMSLAEISKALNAQPSAVFGMITMLVKKGKLIEMNPGGQICTACAVQSQCNLLAARTKRYICAPTDCPTHPALLASTLHQGVD